MTESKADIDPELIQALNIEMPQESFDKLRFMAHCMFGDHSEVRKVVSFSLALLEKIFKAEAENFDFIIRDPETKKEYQFRIET